MDCGYYSLRWLTVVGIMEIYSFFPVKRDLTLDDAVGSYKALRRVSNYASKAEGAEKQSRGLTQYK